MLTHPTLDKLQTLKLSGMYQALVEQLQMSDITALSFEERFGLLVDRELTERDNRRLTTRLRQAKLRQTACIEDIDYRHPRGLDKAVMTRLATCQWVREHHNVWGLAPLSEENRRDLLEIIEDRHDCRATLVTSQLPVEHWYEALGDPTLADAILDRLVHNAYKITLQGESMRKRQARLTRGATTE